MHVPACVSLCVYMHLGEYVCMWSVSVYLCVCVSASWHQRGSPLLAILMITLWAGHTGI